MDGQMVGYQSETRGDSQLTRMKKTAAVSHMRAQQTAFLSLLNRPGVAHLIVTRTYDDTNVTVAPTTKVVQADNAAGAIEDQDLDQQPLFTTAGKLGRRKVSPLLGIIQRVTVRSSTADVLESAQLHSPSQVLPKVRGFGNKEQTHEVLEIFVIAIAL